MYYVYVNENTYCFFLTSRASEIDARTSSISLLKSIKRKDLIRKMYVVDFESDNDKIHHWINLYKLFPPLLQEQFEKIMKIAEGDKKR